MTEDGWGDGPVWICAEDAEPPACDDHGSVVGPVELKPVIPIDGDSVEFNLIDGYCLYYCGLCPPMAPEPDVVGVDDSEHDAATEFIHYMESVWEGVEEYFERVGEPSKDTMVRMLTEDRPNETTFRRNNGD